MPDSYNNSIEDPQEPSQPVCPALPVHPPGDVQAPPDSVPVAALQDNQDNLSIINGQQNFFVPATSDPDQQAMTLLASNGTFQKEEHNGGVKSDVADDTTNTTQTWHIFSHEISVKTGFPGSESWSQENGHNAEVIFDSLELEEKTLKLSVVKGQALSQPATHDLETRPQEEGHNGKVGLDTLELEEVTLILSVEEGQAVAQPAIYDLTVVIPTRNERDNIMPLLQELQEALDGIRVEIIFVDDSDDDTPLIIKDASVAMEKSMFHVHLEHRQPRSVRAGGLATAVVHGMNRAQSEYVAVIDADLQHPPELLRMLYDQAVAQNADLVLASRYIKGGSYRGLAGVGRRFISVGLKWTAKLLFPGRLQRISDPLSGFFLLRRSLLADVSLRPIGYKILLEILIRCQWRQVLEVPYHFQVRAHGQSKATMQQGILALRHMLRLWREVPAAGRIWKISFLILVNVLITLALFNVNKSFPWVWANLNIVVFAVMACLDFVLLSRFIFPSKASLQRITIPTTLIVDANADGQFEVTRYAERMTTEAKRNNNGSHQEESKKYKEGQDNTPVAPTSLEKTLVAQSITSFQAPRPVVRRRRRLLSIAGIVLLVVLILVSVRVNIILSASNDELLVRIGDQSASIVDLRQAFPISPYLLGANVFPASGTDSLDHPLTGFMNYGPLVIKGLLDAHIHLLRFPGGNWGEEHRLSYDQLNSFSTLLSKVGAEGMVQTYLSGQIGTGLYPSQPGTELLPNQPSLQDRANLAGQWVDYMNNPHSRLRTGKYAYAPFHPVKFWVVGNEPDLLLNPDTGKRFTVKEYTDAFIQFSLVMHQNNPTIQVFGPEISQFYGVGLGPKDATGQLWMEGFLKGVSDYEKAHPTLKFHLLDGVSFHRYPLGDATSAPGVLLTSTNEWIYILPPLRQLFRQDFGRDAPVAVTEINSNPTKKVPTPGLAALWWADTLGSLMTQRAEYVAFFSAQGVDTPYPLLTTTLEQTAMLRVMQMYSYLQHNYIPVAMQRDPISLYATQDDPHQTLSLLFINKSSAIQSAQVSVKDQFLGLSAWPDTTISLFGNSLTLVTLHRNGGAEAFSYKVPTNESGGVNPVNFAICGNDSDVLSNDRPC